MSFEITGPAVIHCGAGCFGKIPVEAARMGFRAAIITGSHILDSGPITELCEALDEANVQFAISEPVTQEPTVERVDELAAFIRAEYADFLISIGGGSVMDTAKAAALVAVNDGITEDYQLKRREIVNPPLPQIAVPTTAGTGSEATRVSVLTNDSLAIKRSISHPLMTPAVAILDPELTVDLDLRFTTLTAMDAFAHAIESAVSLSATPYTRQIALAAIEHLSTGLPTCQKHPHNLQARLDCLMGSCFAGLAMQNGLGASHSLAPAVCIVGKIRHSEAIAALLPEVIKLNEQQHPAAYDDVSRAMGADNVAERLIDLCRAGGLPTSLSDYGLTINDKDAVMAALNRYGSHRRTNPVEVTDDYACKLFEACFRG